MKLSNRAVALILAVALCALWVPAAGAKKKPKPPAEWDERVLPFVKFVENTRALEFEHPVPVRFLNDEQMEKELRSEEEPTKKDKEFEAQIAGELLALGLIAEAVDLSQASEDLAAADVVGFYDTEVEELVIRGEGSDSIDAEVTIVHELTHALQDQVFNLDKLYNTAKEGSEALILDFLIEGDATTVESEYLTSLSQKKQDEYFGFVDDATSGPLPEGVPYALDIFSAAPYVLGEAFVYALDPEGGTRGRDRAFENPPKTEEVLFDPVALDEQQVAKKVPNPKLEAGEEKAYDPEQFGVLTLYLMLATRLDARTALEAVTGWGGDRYVGFKEDGDVCLRVNITGDTKRDTDELDNALVAWAAEMPVGAADVERDDDLVTLSACATEGVVAPSEEVFDSVFYNVLGGRIYVVLDAATVVDLDDALCIGDYVSTDPAVIELFDVTFAEGREPTEEEYQILDSSYAEAFPTCGVKLPNF